MFQFRVFSTCAILAIIFLVVNSQHLSVSYIDDIKEYHARLTNGTITGPDYVYRNRKSGYVKFSFGDRKPNDHLISQTARNLTAFRFFGDDNLEFTYIKNGTGYNTTCIDIELYMSPNGDANAFVAFRDFYQKQIRIVVEVRGTWELRYKASVYGSEASRIQLFPYSVAAILVMFVMNNVF